MRLVNEKGRLFGLINIVDLLVLIFIVAICWVAFTKTSIMKKVNVLENKKQYEAQFFVKGVMPLMAEQLKVGDTLLEDSTNTVIGQITDVQITTAKSDVETADGRVVTAENKARNDVVVTTEGLGQFDPQRGLTFANKDWQAGGAIVIKTSKVKFGCNILKVEVK